MTYCMGICSKRGWIDPILFTCICVFFIHEREVEINFFFLHFMHFLCCICHCHLFCIPWVQFSNMFNLRHYDIIWWKSISSMKLPAIPWIWIAVHWRTYPYYMLDSLRMRLWILFHAKPIAKQINVTIVSFNTTHGDPCSFYCFRVLDDLFLPFFFWEESCEKSAFCFSVNFFT